MKQPAFFQAMVFFVPLLAATASSAAVSPVHSPVPVLQRLVENIRNAANPPQAAASCGKPGFIQSLSLPSASIPTELSPSVSVKLTEFHRQPSTGINRPEVPRFSSSWSPGAVAGVPRLPMIDNNKKAFVPPVVSPPHYALVRSFALSAKLSQAKPSFSTSRLLIKLPRYGVKPEVATRFAAKIVFEGLLDGTLDSSKPEWRPHLACLLSNPQRLNPDTIFSLLVTTCEGVDDSARLAHLEKWSREYETGQYAGTILFFCAQRFFNAGDYRETSTRCTIIEKDYPELAVRALLLRALSEAYAGDMKKAHAILDAITSGHPDSPDLPEVRYMEAWLALQEMHEESAKAILKSITYNYPDSPAATKAATILKSLESPE